MKRMSSVFVLFFLLLATSLAQAQDFPGQGLPAPQQPQDPWPDNSKNAKTQTDQKTVAERLREFQKKLEKLDREFEKKKTKLEKELAKLKDKFEGKKADLEKKIAGEQNEKKRAKLENKLRKETDKYEKNKAKLEDKLRKETEKYGKKHAEFPEKIASLESPPVAKSTAEVPAEEIESASTGELDKHPREKWINKKATEKAIKKVEERLADIRKEYGEKEAKLQAKLKEATEEEAQSELRAKLEELTARFKEEESKSQTILKWLELFPIERRTQSADQPLMLIGNCHYSDRHASMTSERVIDSNGEPQDCRYFHSQMSFRLRVTNPSPELQSSSCWRSEEQAFVFEPPSAMIFYYWGSKTPGGAPIYVFVDMPVVARYAQGNFTETSRDQALLDVCPSKSPQRHYPQPGNWILLNFAADPGSDYDQIINNVFGGMGGGRARTGFEGMEKAVKAEAVNDLEVRNVVFDSKFLELADKVRAAWLPIEEAVLPIWLAKKKNLDSVRNLKIGIEKLHKEEGLKALIAECDSHKDIEIFLEFAKELAEAQEALSEGNKKRFEKTLKGLIKKVKRTEKQFEREFKPLGEPFGRISYLLSKKEFVAAGQRMRELFEALNREGIFLDEEKIKQYQHPAKELQDYIESQKWVWSRRIGEGEALEPIQLRAGEDVVFHVSLLGGKYDFERNEPRLKIVLQKAFAPPSPDGTMDKNAKLLDGLELGLFRLEELLKNGFDTAVVETKNGKSAIVAVRGNIQGAPVEMQLRGHLSGEGVQVEEISLQELKEKHEVFWVWGVLSPPGERVSFIPSSPNRFLETIYFAGPDSMRLTVFSLVFFTRETIPWKPENAAEGFKPLKLDFFLHPGLYRYKIMVIDLLEEDPFKRIVETPLPDFRILEPEK